MGNLLMRWRVLVVVLLGTGCLAALIPPAQPVTAAGNHKLPTPPNVSYLVTQGNNSGGTHGGDDAWAFDFYVPENTQVLASRAGIVQMIKQNSNTGGCNSSYANDGNYIVIDHQDGTRTLYLHLKLNGIAPGIDIGDFVEQGQHIANSGATGYVCAPPGFSPAHLHFEVQTYSASSPFSPSLPVFFADYNHWFYNGVPPHRAPPFFESVTSRNYGFVPLAKKWYVAEGYTGTNFDEYLTIQNPNPTSTSVTITYYVTGQSPTVKNLSILPNKRYTVVVHDTYQGVGRGQAVSALVEANQPVIVERPMYFKYGGGLWDGGHNGVGVTPYHDSGQYVWWFAEGWTGPGFDQYISVQNSSDYTAQIDIIYMLSTGGGITKTRSILPRTRDTWNVRDHVGSSAAVSTKVVSMSSGVQVIAERPMYFAYNGSGGVSTGGHVAAGALTPEYSWYFADGSTMPGFDTYFTIQNPGSAGPNNPTNQPATVTFKFYRDNGTLAATYSTDVPAQRRFTLNARTDVFPSTNIRFSAEISSNYPIVAERPMYFGGFGTPPDGTVVVGTPKPEYTLYFAEGTTVSTDFTENLVIHNTWQYYVASVTVQYIFADEIPGQPNVVTKNYTIPAKEFIEKNVRTEIGNRDVSMKVTSDVPIVAERPMYFTYYGLSPGGPGQVLGGHTAMGISP